MIIKLQIISQQEKEDIQLVHMETLKWKKSKILKSKLYKNSLPNKKIIPLTKNTNY